MAPLRKDVPYAWLSWHWDNKIKEYNLFCILKLDIYKRVNAETWEWKESKNSRELTLTLEVTKASSSALFDDEITLSDPTLLDVDKIWIIVKDVGAGINFSKIALYINDADMEGDGGGDQVHN